MNIPILKYIDQASIINSIQKNAAELRKTNRDALNTKPKKDSLSISDSAKKLANISLNSEEVIRNAIMRNTLLDK